jgi:hypothetical protein
MESGVDIPGKSGFTVLYIKFGTSDPTVYIILPPQA